MSPTRAAAAFALAALLGLASPLASGCHNPGRGAKGVIVDDGVTNVAYLYLVEVCDGPTFAWFWYESPAGTKAHSGYMDGDVLTPVPECVWCGSFLAPPVLFTLRQSEWGLDLSGMWVPHVHPTSSAHAMAGTFQGDPIVLQSTRWTASGGVPWEWL